MLAKPWLKSKPHLIGPFVRLPRPEIIELLALAGFDFAVVDLEHGPITVNEVYPMLLAAEKHKMRLLARVPAVDESYFKWLLDLGIGGLQVPHIETAEDAAAAVKFSLFSPAGDRGLCRFTRAARFSDLPGERYLQEANENRLLVLQIEGAKGVKNIREIIKIPGFDVLFIGPYDLSQSLGLPGQIWHPDVVAAINEVVRICSENKIEVGVFSDSPQGIQKWASLGVRYLNYRVEVEIFLSALRKSLQEVSDAIK